MATPSGENLEGEFESDSKIAELKKQKRTSKTALTKAVNKLSNLLEQEHPSRKLIRTSIDQVCSLQSKVVTIIYDLTVVYRSVGDLENFKKTKKEIDIVDESMDEIVTNAQVFLDNTLSTTVSQSASSVHSGIPNLFKDDSVSQKVDHVSDKQPSLSNGGSGNNLNIAQENASVHNEANSLSVKSIDQSPKIGQDLWRQLKRVSIPTFSGKIQLYDSWRAAFMACVHSAPATNEYKLLQLKQYLSGEAAQLISKLGHSAAAYEVALEKLDRKYGGKRRLVALQLEEVTNFKPIRPGRVQDFERFADMLDVVTVNLRENDLVEELGGGYLYTALKQKLTESLIVQYQRFIYEQQRQESVETLREWVRQESEFFTIANETKQGLAEKKPVPKSGTYFGAQQNTKSLKCSFCQAQNHDINKCFKFKALDVGSRWSKVKDLKLCFRCLGIGHVGKLCSHTLTCGIDGCAANHNRLLHSRNTLSSPLGLAKEQLVPLSSKVDDETKSSQPITMSTSKPGKYFCALRTVPVVVKNKDRKLTVNALLDDGSTQTYINEDVIAELGLSGLHQSVSVKVLNNKTETFESCQVEFGLESLDGSIDMEMSGLSVGKVTGSLEVIDWQKQKQRWSHLKQIDFPKVATPLVVDILIGIDYPMLHNSLQEVYGLFDEPTARLTPLGWTCIAKVGQSSSKQPSRSFYAEHVEAEAKLNELVQSFWEVDQVPEKIQKFSPENQKVVDYVQESLAYKDGRYEVGVPWRPEVNGLPENYKMAYNRLLNTEKRLGKDDKIDKAYGDVIKQYEAKGYIRKVPEHEVKQTKWYLPHFPVIKSERETTKIRIVFDASAKERDISLNDVTSAGPKLQNDLFAILLRFRKNRVALVGDIAEMYLQIQIKKSDRPFCRFLWREDKDKPPEVFEFSRVIFGMNCSPFLAQYVTQKHAKLKQDDLPLAAETVIKSTYMDDSLESVESEEKAIALYGQLNQLWHSAGMHARKWVSNSHDVVAHIPTKDRLKEVNIAMSELPQMKALGLIWSPEDDQFRFSKETLNEVPSFTKRSFLKETAKLFDPLGLLAPFSIRAKMLLQEMWLSGVDWDDTISPDLDDRCHQWFSEMTDLKSLTYPRCISSSDHDGTIQFHVFVDASEQAYGTVVYSVSRSKSGHGTSQIVASKCKVAPLKATTIPRMELLSAALGVKLAEAVADALGCSLSSFIFWSDSQNVLCWIRNQSRTFKPFVANRVGFIHEHTHPSQWKYVPTNLNVADTLSRGSSVEFLRSRAWQSGPDFIGSKEDDWPEQPIQFQQTEATEMKQCSKEQASFVGLADHDDGGWRLEPSNYSDLTRLCRVLAWIYRFLSNSRSPKNLRKYGELDVEELQDAETKIVLGCQREAFSEELSALSKNKSVLPKSKLVSLNPFLDENGVMRSGGRLRFTNVLAFDARCPIILPRKHPTTKLIVKLYHEQTAHMGTNSTLSALSSKYWVISAREEIREWEKECCWCRRKKAKPVSQIMGDLPEIRIRSTRAFDQTAVDFAGPFITTQGRGKRRQKRYLCLFTCLTTRAVHLEMAFGLDADSFLNAFFRFSHRRGLPQQMISDNGTNFVGASKELQLLQGLDCEKVMSTLAVRSVKWTFNPPNAPHFGGVFESLIKSAKRAIYAILSSGDISDEELMTSFSGAEALINSRPLTYQSAHPEDETPLTPNHFLHGQLGGRFAPEMDDSPFNPRKRWRRIQELLRHFWKRWMREWLPSLNVRKKWRTETRNYQVGDIVIVVSPDTARGYWPLGRVLKTHPGRDGHVRVVDVQVGNSKLTRPVTRICPLEWQHE